MLYVQIISINSLLFNKIFCARQNKIKKIKLRNNKNKTNGIMNKRTKKKGMQENE